MATLYTVKPNQSMPDVIIQATGSLEAGMQFCEDNNVRISDMPAVSASMVVSDTALTLGDQQVVQYLAQNSIVIGTLNYIPPAPAIYHRSLTINHTKCGGSDSSNFPVLVSITNPALKTMANGGHVRDTNGYDLQFFADGAMTTLLNWEVEHYDGSAGTLIAWVKLPTVSHATDTVFYMQYGDLTISSFKGGAAGSVWNSAFMMVHHFGTASALATLDSTSNGNNGTIGGATANTGIVNGCANIADGNYIEVASSGTLYSTTGTWSGWVKTTLNNSSYNTIWSIVRNSGYADFGIAVLLINGKLYVSIKGPGTFQWPIAGSAFIADGNWHHISVVFNSGTPSALYVDGVADGTVSTGVWTFAGQVFRFGAGIAGFWEDFVGETDEFRMSNVNRSADWVLTEFNNIKDPGGFITVGAEAV